MSELMTGSEAAAPSSVRRSAFVTGLAWVMIGMGAVSTVVAILQNIAFASFFSGAQFEQILAQMEASGQALQIHVWLFRNMGTLLVFGAVFSVGTFAAGIGLLRRKGWARKVVLAYLALAIFMTIGGVALQHVVFSQLSSAGLPLPEQALSMIATTRIATYFMSALACLFYAWLIRKLVSPAIVAEFRASVRQIG